MINVKRKIFSVIFMLKSMSTKAKQKVEKRQSRIQVDSNIFR